MSDPPNITLERITNIPNRLQLRDRSNEIICPVLKVLYNKGYLHDEERYTVMGLHAGTLEHSCKMY